MTMKREEMKGRDGGREDSFSHLRCVRDNSSQPHQILLFSFSLSKLWKISPRHARENWAAERWDSQKCFELL